MIEVIVGAVIMLVGMVMGYAISSGKGPRGYEGTMGTQGPQGPKGDICLCQCDEEVGMKQGEGEYPPAPITDISTTDYWSGYKKGNIDDNKDNPDL